ncbi:MAG: ArsB/NhaD family transporter [Desulfarculus sp.]|nr:ArsB/NhaD family transporter [Desulfarculus sp.]
MRKWVSLLTLLTLLALLCPTAGAAAAANAGGAGDILVITGKVANAQGKGVKDAGLEIAVNGQKLHLDDELVTLKDGKYHAEVKLPAGALPAAKVTLEVKKPSYHDSGQVTLGQVFKDREDDKGNAQYLAQQNVTIKRSISPAFWIATLVLLAVYVLIAFELMHRTLAAVLGGSLLLTISYTAGTFNPAFFVMSFEDAMKAIDMNVIFLLMAMMIIVGVMKKTGVFQWLAYKAFQLAKGNVYVLAAFMMFITAFVSAFLDNVTTMLLIIPVTMEICGTLKINPIALLLPEAFASNVGGTATLIGDPPNIMIGSYAKLTFVDFVSHLSIICFLCLIVTIIWYVWWYKKDYQKAEVKDVPRMTEYLREAYKITNAKLLAIGGTILAITIFLFIVHGALHMEPSVAALIGAAVLLVLSKVDIVEMLEKEIEWPTLIFFMFLFVVVSGAEEAGLIQIIADWVKDMSQGSKVVAIILILWVSAIASAFIDNIPFTATMLPIVAYLTEVIPGAQTGVLWWALSLGACLGGNGTMIGASANVVTSGMAEKAGYPISFMAYMKAAWWPMIITIFMCMGWLLLVEK